MGRDGTRHEAGPAASSPVKGWAHHVQPPHRGATVTATTRTDQRPDVHEMVVVHRAFRREFAATAGLIRSTPEGDIQPREGRRRPPAPVHGRPRDAPHRRGRRALAAAPRAGRAVDRARRDDAGPAPRRRRPRRGHRPRARRLGGRPDQGRRRAARRPSVERLTAGLRRAPRPRGARDPAAGLASRDRGRVEPDGRARQGRDEPEPAADHVRAGARGRGRRGASPDARATSRCRSASLLKTVGAWQFRRYVRRLRAS